MGAHNTINIINKTNQGKLKNNNKKKGQLKEDEDYNKLRGDLNNTKPANAHSKATWATNSLTTRRHAQPFRPRTIQQNSFSDDMNP